MKRRDFLKDAAGIGTAIGLLGTSQFAQTRFLEDRGDAETAFPHVKNLTRQMAEFIVGLQLSDVPTEVLELGKKSILDGLGLALSGSKAETWGLVHEYLRPFISSPDGGATVLGS